MTIQTNIPNPNGDGTMLTTDDLRRLGWDQATLPGRNDYGEWLNWTYKAIHHRDGCKGQHSELRTSSNVGDVDDNAILARFEYLCSTCQRMLGTSGTGGAGTRRVRPIEYAYCHECHRQHPAYQVVDGLCEEHRGL